MRAPWLALAAAISLALAACAGSGPSAPVGAQGTAGLPTAMPTTFFAISQSPSHGFQVETLSSLNGKVLEVMPGLPTGNQLQSLQASAGGSIWVTTSSGPRFRNGTAGGDPAPRSCSSSIMATDHRGAQAQTVWSFPPSELVGQATASPSGQRVAYLSSGCVASFADSHLVIRSRHGGSQVLLGANAVTCHVMTAPSWSANGTELTFTYAPSSLGRSHGHVTPGVCPAWHSGELVVVSTRRSAGVSAFHLLAAPSGCGYVAAAFDRWGIAAVETCGYQGMGSSYLEQVTIGMTVQSRLALEPGSDPTSLSAAPGGRYVLVDEYQAPATHGRPLPWDWIWVFNGVHLHLIRKYPDVNYGLSDACW